ncbi:MAG: FRG domain-containing protein [Helicobacteraceae bacterium]|jgi:hypothetical protein|nr:FRG domain-containing protein [Helicobacteraceae bacterium]
MSVDIKTFNSPKEAMEFLENLALIDEDFIFRGQPSPNDKLSTSLRRLTGAQEDKKVDDLLRRFEIALAKIGIFPFEKAGGKLDWLEYARHCGAPLPVIDFTYSPYIALFFAFNQMESNADMDSFVTVLALNARSLAKGWAKAANRAFGEDDYLRFKNASESQFDDGFKAGVLQLIPFPAKKNRRMLGQMGALLYDTLDYRSLGFNDLEDFIASIDDSKNKNPALIKVNIHKSCAQSVFERLELMNITGSQLFLNEYGAAMDAVNSYFYNSRIHFRDLDNR